MKEFRPLYFPNLRGQLLFMLFHERSFKNLRHFAQQMFWNLWLFLRYPTKKIWSTGPLSPYRSSLTKVHLQKLGVYLVKYRVYSRMIRVISRKKNVFVINCMLCVCMFTHLLVLIPSIFLYQNQSKNIYVYLGVFFGREQDLSLFLDSLSIAYQA